MNKKTFEILETKNEFHANFKYENNILTKKEKEKVLLTLISIVSFYLSQETHSEIIVK